MDTASLIDKAKVLSGGPLLMHLDRALKAPAFFSFGELLDLQNVQACDASRVEVLKLLAYGNYSDFKGNPSRFGGALDGAVLAKLKQLSLVTLTSQKKVLRYDELQSSLDLANAAEVEQLIISAIYGGLIKGKLDQRSATLLVDSAIGREVTHDQLPQLSARLGAWQAAVSSALKAVEVQIGEAASARTAEDLDRRRLAKAVADTRSSVAADDRSGASAAHRYAGMGGLAGMGDILGREMEGMDERGPGAAVFDQADDGDFDGGVDVDDEMLMMLGGDGAGGVGFGGGRSIAGLPGAALRGDRDRAGRAAKRRTLPQNREGNGGRLGR